MRKTTSVGGRFDAVAGEEHDGEIVRLHRGERVGGRGAAAGTVDLIVDEHRLVGIAANGRRTGLAPERPTILVASAAARSSTAAGASGTVHPEGDEVDVGARAGGGVVDRPSAFDPKSSASNAVTTTRLEPGVSGTSTSTSSPRGHARCALPAPSTKVRDLVDAQRSTRTRSLAVSPTTRVGELGAGRRVERRRVGGPSWRRARTISGLAKRDANCFRSGSPGGPSYAHPLRARRLRRADAGAAG